MVELIGCEPAGTGGVRLSAPARAGGSTKIAVAAESDAGEPLVAATPETIKDWSRSSLKEKLIKISAKVISRGVAFEMAEVAVTRQYSEKFCSRRFAADG